MSVRAIRNLLTRRPAWYGLVQGLEYEQKAKIFELVGYEPHEKQKLIHASTAPIRTVCCGRRFGKSFCASSEAIVAAVLGGGVWCVAPDYELSSIVFEEALNMVLNSPLKSLLASEPRMARGRQAMVFQSGGWILGKSSHKPRSLLGRGLDFVIYDEAATEDNGEIYNQYLLPVLLDRGGSLLLISTPRGDNWFRDVWEKGALKTSGYESFQFSTRDNPIITDEAFARLTDGYPRDLFRQEFLAVFLDNVGALFKGYREVSNLSKFDDFDPDSEIFPVIGMDYGRHNDYTVFCVIDALTGRELYLERLGEMHLDLIYERALAVEALYPGAPWLIDATGVGDPIFETLEYYLTSPIEPFVFTNASKVNIMNQLAVAIQEKEVALIAQNVVSMDGDREVPIGRLALGEMSAYRYERTPSGRLTMNAPPGKHDDIVTARALALEAAYRYVGTLRKQKGSNLKTTSDEEERSSMQGTFAPGPRILSPQTQGTRNFGERRIKRRR